MALLSDDSRDRGCHSQLNFDNVYRHLKIITEIKIVFFLFVEHIDCHYVFSKNLAQQRHYKAIETTNRIGDYAKVNGMYGGS